MEQLAGLPLEFLVDPAMIAVAIVFTGLLVSGLAARMIELVEDRLPGHAADSERTAHESNPFTSAPERRGLTPGR